MWLWAMMPARPTAQINAKPQRCKGAKSADAARCLPASHLPLTPVAAAVPAPDPAPVPDGYHVPRRSEFMREFRDEICVHLRDLRFLIWVGGWIRYQESGIRAGIQNSKFKIQN